MKDRKSEKKREISFLLKNIYYKGRETFLYAFLITSINISINEY